VTNGRITGYRFHLMNGSGCRSSDKRTLDTAMLKSERNLEMKYLLTMTLKTKVPRFNNAGMHRSYRNFVYCIPLYPVEIHYPWKQSTAITTAPETFTFNERLLKTNRLKPGVPFRTGQTLFGNLAFE
jgi:hypothetical protein